MKNIIFMSPPAAGKGTISDMLVESLGYIHISTGEILREEINSGSEFGKEINEIITSGGLVNDDIMVRLVRDKLSFNKDKPFILDGFPRTLNQAEMLNEIFLDLNINNILVAYLEINLDDALKRALGRVICPSCKKSYNIYYDDLKPKSTNICDDCKVELEKRSDDTEETFKVRFNTYLENASSIMDYYKDKKVFKKFNALSSPNEILENILKEVKND